MLTPEQEALLSRAIKDRGGLMPAEKEDALSFALRELLRCYDQIAGLEKRVGVAENDRDALWRMIAAVPPAISSENVHLALVITRMLENFDKRHQGAVTQ